MDVNLSDLASSESVSFTARDRTFFNSLMQYMDVETAKVGPRPSKERFGIHRLAFEKIIDKSSLYRPIFRAIKQEYEQCIHALETGAEEVQAMSEDLHRLVLQPKTFLLRQKRCMELEDKLTIIEQENRQLERAIEEIREQMKQEELEATKATQAKTQQSIKARTGHRRVPGLTFAEETNIKTLEKYLEFLRGKYARFEENATTKYTSKERRWELQRQFQAKQQELDQEREQRLILRNRLRLYHLTLKTIQDYINAEEEPTSKMQINQPLLEDAIWNAIYQSSNLFAKSDQNEEDDFDTAALYDREAGVLLNHIEQFMELMERGNYKEASYIAACSPKGVLRNMETLLKFKAIKKPMNEDMTPWLFHCKILAETALEAPFKPDAIMSLECAKAASHENRLDLLCKWISENRLTVSMEMAQLLERANALDSAEFIYRRMGAHYEVATCLLRKGSTKRCIDYLISVSKAIPSMKELLIKLFHEHPTVKFAVDIIKSTSNKYFQADELVLYFLQLDQHLNAIQFVEKLIEEKGSSCEKEEAEKLKTCFELLKKYSYLADDKTPSPHSTEGDTECSTRAENDLAGRLTRKISRAALERFRRIRRSSNAASVTLEPIEEHPPSQVAVELDSPAEPEKRSEEDKEPDPELETDSKPESETTPHLCHQDFFNDFPGQLYFTEDTELKTDDPHESSEEEI